MTVSIEEVHAYLTTEFNGLAVKPSWGERACFYNPDGQFANGVYFLTIKERDGANDRASALDRPGVWRMNFGLTKPDYAELFGPRPLRPAKGGVIEGPWDFTRLDELMPHPIYGWMGWVCVLSPTQDTFERCKPILSKAYRKVVDAAGRRK
jgi:hypothetical protein